jgi:hypothetical protein
MFLSLSLKTGSKIKLPSEIKDFGKTVESKPKTIPPKTVKIINF